MEFGKVAYQGKTSKGKELIIRYPNKDDAQLMREYINTLSEERTFIRFQGEKVSLEEETKYLNSQLERIRKKETVHLLVLSNNKIIGISSIDMKDRVNKHVGEFGISIAKDYRGEGLGTLLMKFVVDEAVKNIPQLEIITLGVFSNNSLAIEMYRKFGFVEYGDLPNGVKFGDKYVDHIYMYKLVKNQSVKSSLQ